MSPYAGNSTLRVDSRNGPFMRLGKDSKSTFTFYAVYLIEGPHHYYHKIIKVRILKKSDPHFFLVYGDEVEIRQDMIHSLKTRGMEFEL